MSNYVKTTDFAAKDALASGNAAKIVKGTEIDAELTAIGTAIATKADLASPTFTGAPLSTTPAYSDDSTKIATTAFVHSVIPSGGIIMWSGTIATIPLGWLLCDGTNDTPDLRDKFIIGATADSSGAKTNVTGSYTQTGGSKDAINVSHTHSLTDPGHAHTMIYGQGSGGSTSPTWSVTNSGSTTETGNYSVASNTTGISVSSSGSSGTNANLPPYYALAFIMKA